MARSCSQVDAAIAKRATSAKRRWSIWVPAVLLFLAGILFAVLRLNYQRTSVPVGSDVVFDDFAFAVLDAKREHVQRPHWSRYLITVECQNRAKRVDFTFKPEMVVATIVPSAPKFLRRAPESWTEPVGLKAGETCRRTLIFEGPKDVHSLDIWFRTGGGFGDFMDGLFDQRYEVVVPFK
jgi:hypothetical protein